MNTNPDIFQYENAADFLKAKLQAIQKKNPKFSARAWALKLKMPFPANLSRILAGQRRLTVRLARKLAQELDLSAKEAAHLEVLAEMGRIREPAVVRHLKAGAELPAKNLSSEVLGLFSKWYFSVIVEMLSLKQNETGVDWIVRRLGGRVSSEDIKSVLEFLKSAGIAQATRTGFLRRHIAGSLANFTLEHEASVEAFLASQIEQSRLALRRLPVGQRKLSSVTVALRAEDVSRAKKIMDRASAELLKLGADEDADQVYQFNAQFFAVTESDVSK